MRRNQSSKLKLGSLVGVLVAGLIATLAAVTVQAAPSYAPPIPGVEAWTEPQIMLSRASNPAATTNPNTGLAAYCSGSKGWGLVVGQEDRNWRGGYTKVSGSGGNADCLYDASGTIHVVWEERVGGDRSPAILQYAKITRDGAASRPRNLTRELFGSDFTMVYPSIAYSSRTNKLYIAVRNQPENPTEDKPNYVFESADQGATWQRILTFSSGFGYRPTSPRVVVEPVSGEPMVLWGTMNGDDSESQINAQIRTGGSWAAPVVIERVKGSYFYIKTATSANSVYASWVRGGSDKRIQVAKFSGGSWNTPKTVGIGINIGGPAITVGTNGYVWAAWPDEDNVEARFAVSTDGGTSWTGQQAAFIGRDKYYSRISGMSMTTSPTTKRIRLFAEVSQDDPAIVQAETIVLAEISETLTRPPLPTAAPPARYPTPTPAAGSRDEYEPDGTLTAALAKASFLEANGASQAHSLYDPSNPDRKRDTDVIPFVVKAGKYYTVDGTSSGNKNLQLKTSVYSTKRSATGQNGRIVLASLATADEEATFIGAASECNDNKQRLCFTFKAETSGIYYAQMSNYLEGNGSPQDVYIVKLLETDEPPTSPSPTPDTRVSPTIASPTAIADTLPPTTTVAPTSTPLPTATLSPTTTPRPTTQAALPPAQGNPGNGNAIPPTATAKLPATPVPPTATLTGEEAARATAQANNRATAQTFEQSQAIAALTPQIIAINDYTPVVGGQGPQLAPPDYTAPPTVTPTRPATTKAVETTAGGKTEGAGAASTPRPTAGATGTTGTAKEGETKPKKISVVPLASWGEWWMLVIVVLIIGKIGLNLLGKRGSKTRAPATAKPTIQATTK